jgi:homoprotocatechuate degradation regulator HpaR
MADKKPVAEFPRPRIMDDRRSLPIALLRAREAVMAYFRPHHRKGGITEQQWRVVRVLYLDGEMDAAALAQRSYLLAPSLSRILKDLEAAGLLVRRPDDEDSRRSLMSLSPKGTAIVTGAGPFLDGIHREIARRFGPARVQELLAMLDELERALADPPSERVTKRKAGRKQK